MKIEDKSHPMKLVGKKLNKFAVIGLVLILLPSCASFRGNRLEPISSWPPAAGAPKKTISIITKGFASVNGGATAVVWPEILEDWNEIVVKAYTDSGLFSQVVSGEGQTDLQAEIEILDQGKGNVVMALLTGLTLFIFPSSATDTFTIKTAIKDKNGNVLGSFEKKDSVVLWQQVLLVFVMPFKFPVSVVDQTLTDINRATIHEAYAQGIF